MGDDWVWMAGGVDGLSLLCGGVIFLFCWGGGGGAVSHGGADC